MQVNYST